MLGPAFLLDRAWLDDNAADRFRSGLGGLFAKPRRRSRRPVKPAV
jgi:hypothetical protein